MVCMLECLARGSRLSGLHDGSAAAGRQGGAAAPWAMTGSYPFRVIFHAQLDNSQGIPWTQKGKYDSGNKRISGTTLNAQGVQGLPPGGARARWCVADGAYFKSTAR